MTVFLLLPLLAPALSLQAPRDVLMRVTLQNTNAEAMQGWLMKRPWAAVLPVQPM